MYLKSLAMQSNYKKLGQYIRPVDVRNKECVQENLLGVSTRKVFIESIANTVGTDFKKYKIVRKNQFTYVPDTSRRGDKMGLAMLEHLDKAIVSQAYTVFEIIDHEKLLPEYLMMWFRRPEFDRYARYMSHGSVREIFGWDEMCDIELPVPSPDKQREIVKEYNVIVNRIKLNEQLNQKLEETAQAIYKQWFVDFEFPISAEYAASIGKPELEGKPYKSSGGEMVYCDELEKDIPKGWKNTTLGEFLANKGYIRGPFGSALKKEDMRMSGVPVYEQQHAIYDHRNFRYYIEEKKHLKLKRFTIQNDDIVISCSGTLGKITLIKESDPIGIINQALLILRSDTNKIPPLYLKYFLTSPTGNKSLVSKSGGSAQVNIAKREEIESIVILLPLNAILDLFNNMFTKLVASIEDARAENALLTGLRNIVLSKMARAEYIKEIAA
jgi:type I restriction enzyme S subunit